MAQNEGEILFTEFQKLDIKLPDDLPEEMKARIPTSRSSKKTLFFNATTSLYKNQEQNPNDQVIENKDREDGMEMKVMIKEAKNEMYKDLANANMVEMRELWGKNFLIKDKPIAFAWKMTAEQKEILGYACKKATCINEKDTITAWFTMQIPVSNGPARYSKLPGMILELDINSGKTSVKATKVDLKKLPENTIVAPTKGKEVTAAEFKKIEEEKKKELNEMNGGRGGQMMIRTERH